MDLKQQGARGVDNRRSQQSMRDVAVIGFGLTLAALVIGGALVFNNARRLAHHRDWVVHTHEVIGHLETLLSTLKDARAGQQEFLLVKDGKHLKAHQNAVIHVNREIASIKELTSDNAEQQSRLGTIEKKVNAALADWQNGIDLAAAGDRIAVVKWTQGTAEKALFDDLTTDIVAMQQAERDLLLQRDADVEFSSLVVLWSIGVTTAVEIVLVAVVFYLVQRNIRHRRRAAIVVAEQKERLRTTLASIGDAVITTDTEGRVASMNAVAESLTGWTDADASGQALEVVFHIVNESTREAVESPVARTLRQGVIVGLANHTVLIAKDGTERPIDDSSAPIRSKEGAIVGCVLVFRDVAERRRMELAVSDARAYAESIVDSVREPLVVLDAELRVVSANRAFFQTFHVVKEETEGKRLYDLGNRQWDIPALRKSLEELLLQNKILNGYEVEHVLPEVGQRHMLLNARRVYRAGNHSELVLLAIEDITDRRQLERQMDEQQQATRLLASIVESSDDAIISKTLDSIVRTWNAAAERLFGYTAEQAVGRHISFLIPADRANEEDQIIARLRAGERVEHFDTVRVRRDGRQVQVSLTISPIRDGTGRVIGASKIARNITERKRLEADLRQYAADLSEADRRKNEFLAMLAHELRNPLAPIRNAVHALRITGARDQEMAHAVEMIERQVAQIVRLVDDLLDVSRITRGKIELRKQRVELASLVYHAVDAARSLVDCMGHNLTVKIPPEPIYLSADAARLAQIIGNLLNNACKFTSKGGHIALVVERDGNVAVIRVRDSGIGIAADQLAKIFDMFMQIDTTLERATSGLGIGLTLVKKLVEMHGGTVSAHSDGLGQGSEFVIRLPILADEPAPVKPSVNVPAPKNSRRILIVDDNRDAAQSLAMLLNLTGNQTHTAFDGLEAVQVAESANPDVMLLDIGLPKLNGYEVCRRIRSHAWGQQMVIIALTGWGQEEDRKRSTDAGFDGHMVKPVAYDDLMKLLAKLQPNGEVRTS
jgi:PAS domain S-box-containing protein